MSKKIRIGILVTQQSHPNHNKGKVIGLEEPYVKLFTQYGSVVPIMPDMTPEDVELDMLVLPGGPDLDTSFLSNGKNLVVGNGAANPMYSQFYKHNFKVWRAAGVPILGICLGFQAINVMLGGQLTPDGPFHSLAYHSLHPVAAFSSKLDIKSIQGNNRPLFRLVNSRHHQFIRNNQLAKELIPVAMGVMNDDDLKNSGDAYKLWGGTKGEPSLLKHFYSGKYNLINPKLTHVEAYVHATEKICGVQWHPEDLHRRADDFLRGDFVVHQMITWLLKKPISIPTLVGSRPKNPSHATEQIA